MTRAAPLVTIGIPFFDEGRYLGDAVRSALAQTFTDFELLLVDDGSTDGSLEIARTFRDQRVRILSDGTRRRLPARLNEIVARARGSYVARMDADDVMHPCRLARELDVLQGDPRCDAVGTWAVLVDEAERPFAVLESSELPPSRATALERGIMAHATMLASRSWLMANRYDETLSRAEDRDLWCRTAEAARFEVVPECLYVVRLTPSDARFAGDYVVAQRENRRLYTKYGPAALGHLRTARLLLLSHAKTLAMLGALRAGLGDRVIHRRGRPPSARERALAEEALSAARQRA